MTDFTQEFNEASEVGMRIFFEPKNNFIEQYSIALIFEIRDTKLF